MMIRMIERALFGTAVLLMTALPALAAEAEPAGEPSLFVGDLGNSVWTILIFVLVLVILGKFAWGRILKNLQARESFIHDGARQGEAGP